MAACLVECKIGSGLGNGFLVVGVDNPLHAGGAGGNVGSELGRSVGIERLGQVVDGNREFVFVASEQTVVYNGLDTVGLADYGVVATGVVADLQLAVGVLKGIALVVEHEVALCRGVGNLRLVVVGNLRFT